MPKFLYDNKKDKINNILKNGHLNLDTEIIEILLNRGIDTYEKINDFLNLSLADLHDTRLLIDSEKACYKIIDTIKQGKEITIYGDYDVDGACSTSLLYLSLKNLNANVNFWTNNRFVEGYGLNCLGLEHMLKKYPNTSLIITCDNGIVAYEGIDKANELNVEVIVTDHHEANKILPNAYAIVNPKRKDSEYPFKELCGTGVVFKLMLLLYELLNEDLDYIYDMLDIVSIATVADVVPLLGENRILVKEGIKKVKEESRYVFESLRNITQSKNISSYTFGFIYGPMINALGRLNGSQIDTIEMLISDNKEVIDEKVKELFELNEKRKSLTDIQMELAESILNKKTEIPKVIIISHPDFHEGIVGLIAGRIKEKYYRPTIILSEENGILKGSARSIPNFHIKNVFDELNSYLLKYGGHSMAGGLTLKKENLQEFETNINALAGKMLTDEDFIPKIIIDSVLDANKIDTDLVDKLMLLEPFGEGFQKPIFGLKNFCGISHKYMNDKHFKIKGSNISVIGWNQADRYKELKEPLRVKAIGYPSLNTFNQVTSIQFIIKDNFIFRCK